MSSSGRQPSGPQSDEAAKLWVRLFPGPFPGCQDHVVEEVEAEEEAVREDLRLCESDLRLLQLQAWKETMNGSASDRGAWIKRGMRPHSQAILTSNDGKRQAQSASEEMSLINDHWKELWKQVAWTSTQRDAAVELLSNALLSGKLNTQTPRKPPVVPRILTSSNVSSFVGVLFDLPL